MGESKSKLINKESELSNLELIFKKITYANIIRYLLIAVVISKSYEFYDKGSITPEVDFSNGLFFFIALGIIFYWLYRPTYYDKFFMTILDLVVFLYRKIFKNTHINNYRNYFKEVESIPKKNRMKAYFALKNKVTKKYYTSDINLKASSAHFFAMSSFIFFIFTFITLLSPELETIDGKPYADNRIYWFISLGVTFFIIALIIDIDFERMELDNIRNKKADEETHEDYNKIMEYHRNLSHS